MNDVRLCDHCLLPVRNKDAVSDEYPEGSRSFCCTACRSIFRMIREEGLQDFYRTRDWPSAGIPESLRSAYEDDRNAPYGREGRLRMQARAEGGEREAELLIEGIRCASCVWLNEKILERTPGVLSARVSFATHGAHVKWDDAVISLERILARLRSIGYLARPYTPAAREASLREENRDLLIRFGTAAFFSMQLMLLSFGLYAGYFQGIDPPTKRWLSYAAFLSASPVLFYSGLPFLRGALRGLRNGVLNMDSLISIGAFAAYGLSVVNLLSGGEVYFDTSAMIVTLILLGRLLENSARQRASGAVARLLALQPRDARLVRGDDRIMVPASDISTGDRVEVRPGERVPVDGIVIEGRSDMDESLVTGESRPVEKTMGSAVIGGALNGLGVVVLEVTKAGDDTLVARMARLVESAQAAAAPIQRLADRVSGWIIPFVIAAAVGTAWYWSRHASGSTAVLHAVSVLVIACPCALGLATPVAILAGTGSAARRGVLIRGGDVLERMRSIDTVLFDKTGTLTTGMMTVSGIFPANPVAGQGEREILQAAASAERSSEHLLGAAIVRHARELGMEPVVASEFEAMPGRGVRTAVGGAQVLVGTRRHLEEAGVAVDPFSAGRAGTLEKDGAAVVWVAMNGVLSGLIAMHDPPRHDAAVAIGRLRDMGIDVRMITGDSPGTAAAVAKAVGIGSVTAGVLPEGKVDEIRRLRRTGHVVAMVGDGINDAPALASADVGMALAGGTDIATETASVVLMRSELMSVVQAMDTARRTFRIIRQNLFWAFAYNSAAIPLAMAGILSPIVAAAAMAASSITVVMNSLRLR